ncbi:MAG: hypothetical protein COB85_01055 [Bacteroidetes bacterium]|nr:MAG: hypothetical protein COB85_01055 [Bacteroidota bacterium]
MSSIDLVESSLEGIAKSTSAVSEARRLKIATFAMVDTNSDPTLVDFAIPSNDDSTKSIELIVGCITSAIAEGLEERKKDKEADAAIAEKRKADKKASAEAKEESTEGDKGAESSAKEEDSKESEEKETKAPKAAKGKAPVKKSSPKAKKATRGKRKRISAATSA